MKVSNPKNIAIIIAIISSLLGSISVAIAPFLFNNINRWLALFIVAIMIFVVVYFVVFSAISEFIYKKIKNIYRTIHHLKINKKDLRKYIKNNSDVFSQVNKDVEEWAISNKQEIESLKNQEKFRRDFLGNVSHELKTPIFNIQGYVLTLLDGGLEDESINREFLLRTEKSIDRMISILEDLDILSKLETNELALEFEKIDILELAKDVVELQEISAQQKNIKLSIKNSIGKKNIYVKGDKEKIRQVLTNLVVNSIKYGKEGGKTEIGFYEIDTNVLIEVNDNGLGIEEKHLPRLFERFYRVDSSRSRDSGGSGLGLAIVKHIVEAHNQSINVRSKINEGSTFSFTLEMA